MNPSELQYNVCIRAQRITLKEPPFYEWKIQFSTNRFMIISCEGNSRVVSADCFLSDIERLVEQVPSFAPLLDLLKVTYDYRVTPRELRRMLEEDKQFEPETEL